MRNVLCHMLLINREGVHLFVKSAFVALGKCVVQSAAGKARSYSTVTAQPSRPL